MTKYERAALVQVNKIRKAERRKALKRLPPGHPNNGRLCPLAKALDGGKVKVGYHFLDVPVKKLPAYRKAGLELCYVDSGSAQFTPPKSFGTFMAWFDAQKGRAKELAL